MPSSSKPISWKYSRSTMKHPINAGLLEEKKQEKTKLTDRIHIFIIQKLIRFIIAGSKTMSDFLREMFLKEI